MVTNEVIFTTQIISIIGFIVTIFVLYRVLVSQKDSTIELLKEKNIFLTDKLTEANELKPDVLAQSLTNRVRLLETEIARLSQDKVKNQSLIQDKEQEFNKVLERAENLKKQIGIANELLDDFSCPQCGAPISAKEYHSECIEYNGRDIDIDHEYIAYECGYSIIDGKVESECKSEY